MAGLGIGAIQSVVAAFAFSGASVLMRHLDQSGYQAEVERHNKALEDLTRSRERFDENEVLKKDRIEQLRQQLADANADISNTNKALDMLIQVQTIQFNGRSFDREPQLSDFYKPSDEMREYQMLFIGGIGLGAGYLIYRIS